MWRFQCQNGYRYVTKNDEQKALQVLWKILEGKRRQYWTRESHNKDGIKLHSCKWVRVCPRGAHTLRWLTTNARHSASQEPPHSHWLRAQRTAFLDSLKPWGSPTLSMGPQIHPPSGRKENLSGCESLYTDLHSDYNVNPGIQQLLRH